MHPHPNYDTSNTSDYAGHAASGSTTSASAFPISTSSTSWPIEHCGSHPAQQQQQQSIYYHSYPYPNHDDSRAAGGSRSMRDHSFVAPTFSSSARSTMHGGAMESIADITQDQYHRQHHNLPLPHASSSSSLPTNATRSMPQIQVEFALPHLPGKARKRHKVATSCNRCRQNKRKCDSQVPCANCKKNNVDCCYTDAQLSRTIWGDSPLSQEKVIGVAANRPKAQGASARGGVAGTMGGVAIAPYTYGPSSVHSLFLPGSVSNDQVPHVNRSQQVLGPQSKSISKALRVAQRGPVQYRAPLFPRESLSSSFTASSSSLSYMNVTGQQPEMKPGNSASAAALTSIPQLMASASASEGQVFTVGDAMIQEADQPQPDLTDRLFVSTLHLQPSSTRSSPQGVQPQHPQQSRGQFGQPSTRNQSGDLSSATVASMHASYDERRLQQTSSSHSSQTGFVSSHESFTTSHPGREGSSFLGNNHRHIEPTDYSPPPFISPADGPPTVSSPSSSDSGASAGLASLAHVSEPLHTTAYPGRLSTTSDLFTSATSTTPLLKTKSDSKHLKTQQEQLQEQNLHHQRQASESQQDFHAIRNFSNVLHQFGSTAGAHSDIYSTAPMSITNPVSGDISGISVNSFAPLDEPWSSSSHFEGSHQYAALYTASSQVHRLNAPTTAATGSSPHEAEVKKIKQERELMQLQKIAGDVQAIKKFDLSILMPRHISQEQDEFFITSSLTATSISGIPNHLLLLPRDANYLVDVFFDHAYFYYPIINRATVELCLMEPHTPHALFVLNIVFMIACRHLARTSDMKRAIQFRERAREVQAHIDSKLRHTRLQGLLLGYLAVYGPFNPVIGLAQGCGTYNVLATTPSSPVEHASSPRSPTSCDVFSELQDECRSVHANRNAIHEAAYQARLWTFWGFFIRDSVARLYFGWPHGMDSMFISAELPKIEGFIGVGGKRSPLSYPMGDPMASVTGKRRGSTMNRDNAQSDKRQMTNAERDGSENVDRANYRNTVPDNSDDDDEGEGDDEASMLNISGKRDALQLMDDDDDPADQDRDEQGRLRLLFGMDGSRKSAKDDIPSFSVLSPKILSEQSKGHHQLLAQETDPVEMSLHMERMKLLVDSEEDSTDGGSYCRVLFLEEIRLWTLGRRVALYLAGRSSNNATMSASACPTTAKDAGVPAAYERPDATSSLGQQGASNLSPRSLADRLSTGPHNGAGVWSEQAWLQDQELQTLQADLIAWDKALPEHLKFRPDVDSEDVNHKINGKMGTLTMSYYTITIMLQSSYLPIPQFLSSRRTGFRGAAASSKSSDRNTAEAEGDVTQKTSSTPALSTRSPSLRSVSTPTSTPVVTAAPSPAADSHLEADPHSSGTLKTAHGQAPPAPSSSASSSPFRTHRRTPSSREYFNTPHQICSQLSNVLLHHVELMLDSYPNWCTVAAKVNHAITAALRVSCLNARLSSSSGPAREEARAGFKMGTDLYKRLAHLPGPLTIRDWPVEEDIQLMMDIEEEFREMMMTQEEQDEALFSSASGEATEGASGAAVETEGAQGVDQPPATSSETVGEASDGRRSPQHLFGLGEEEDYKFEFHPDPLL